MSKEFENDVFETQRSLYLDYADQIDNQLEEIKQRLEKHTELAHEDFAFSLVMDLDRIYGKLKDIIEILPNN